MNGLINAPVTALPYNRQPAITFKCVSTDTSSCSVTINGQVCLESSDEESSSSDIPVGNSKVSYCTYCDATCKGYSQCNNYETNKCVKVNRACGGGSVGYGIFRKNFDQVSVAMYMDSSCVGSTFSTANDTCNDCLSDTLNSYVKCIANVAIRSMVVSVGLMVSTIALLALVLY
ncbi:hypothetical protein SAMD00019534_083750 [Acytostelium subglobosum LB1]|uniref:hypothetical protein n=1 Tax=Acytostelium subglobosum LB1 TaxID=1410327 RepID=UPI000644911B|nr:hypothetical protein SAMD00019534_083750 [Acytostelium subglobosum LB1]GAM25200.1 hypothetical protein SAMD00019534_083750 [Acytostelium subglobosum LB1]|eukprot:XP_012751720.1 hypothetical protein SAMD00019534_083750 [Acytostelium subglobosum LB1]